MKTFFYATLHHLRSLLFTTTALFAGIAVQAQYDYVEQFDNLPTLLGMLANNTSTCASTEWLDAPDNTNGILRFYANAPPVQLCRRHSMDLNKTT
jgi:hypothetical protein